MIYKLASESVKKKDEEHKKVRTREDELREKSKNRATIGALSSAVPIIGPRVSGLYYGVKEGHPIVGFIGGPNAVNGAVAKESDVSTIGSTMAGNAKVFGLAGTGLGALAGARAGLPGAIVGGLTGGVLGGLGGNVVGGAQYNLGYLTGW